MMRLMCLTFLTVLLISCNNVRMDEKIQKAIEETRAAQIALDEKIQTAVAETQSAESIQPTTQPATRIPEPTATVIEPTATASKINLATATQMPLPTNKPNTFDTSAIDLAICKPNTTSLCVLFFGKSNQSLVVTLKQDASFIGGYHLFMNSSEFTCTILPNKSRLYCTGPMQPTTQSLYAELYSDLPKTLIAVGNIIIPPWPTAVPETNVQPSNPPTYP